MKTKGARTMTAGSIIAILGWVAIVVFVIKPGLLAGAFLAIAGGMVIGLIEAYLIWRWWFKGIPLWKR